MLKYLNIKIFFLIIPTTFMWFKSAVFASHNNNKIVQKRRKTFRLGGAKNYKKQTSTPPVKSTKEVIKTINERGRRNSELIESQTSTILVGQERAHKSLQDIKDATKEAAKKVVKTIKKENEKTNKKFIAIGVILLLLITYTYYHDYYVVNKRRRPIKIPRFSTELQPTSIPFFKNSGCTPCNERGLKCWQKFLLLLISLIAAVLLWRRFFNLKQKIK